MADDSAPLLSVCSITAFEIPTMMILSFFGALETVAFSSVYKASASVAASMVVVLGSVGAYAAMMVVYPMCNFMHILRIRGGYKMEYTPSILPRSCCTMTKGHCNTVHMSHSVSQM